MKHMKYLVLGDLHGQKPVIHVDADFDAVITPGDVCPNIGRVREHMFKAAEKHRHGEDVNWYDLMGRENARDAIEQSKTGGRTVLEALNELGKPVYVIPGNWDWTGSDTEWDYLQHNHFTTLIKDLENIVNVDHRTVDTGEECIIGYGECSSPEKTVHSDDLEHVSAAEQLAEQRRYEALYTDIATCFAQAAKPVIFLTHNVPFNTALDTIENPESSVHGRHMGSLIARDITEHKHPVITIGGHMHDHYGVDTVNGTPVLNAGYGNEKNTVITIEHGKVEDLRFHPADAVTAQHWQPQ